MADGTGKFVFLSRKRGQKPARFRNNGPGVKAPLECDNEAISFYGKSSSIDTHLRVANCDASSDLFSNFNNLCLAQTDS